MPSKSAASPSAASGRASMASPPSSRRCTLSCDSHPLSSLASESRPRSASGTGPMPIAPARGCRREPQIDGGSAPARVGRGHERVGLPFGRGLLFG